MTSLSLESILDDLQADVAELSRVQDEKLDALGRLDGPDLERLAQEELQVLQKMARNAKLRNQWLLAISQRIPAFKGRTPTLREIVLASNHPRRTELVEVLDGLRDRAKRVKRTAAANWLVTYRTQQHVEDMLDIFANQGQPAELGETSHGYGVVIDNTL